MDTLIERQRIIRTLAYALRHNSRKFGLDLDPEGWTEIDQLVEAFRFQSYDWSLLEWSDVENIIRGSDRFEVRDGRIRAVYGHSFELKKLPEIATPPPMLFHGTSQDRVPDILRLGILPMGRRFAHFSSDIHWVLNFLSNKPEWTIFAVQAEAAAEHGIAFRQANFHVWLADSVDPQFLTVHSSHGFLGAGVVRDGTQSLVFPEVNKKTPPQLPFFS